VRCAREDRFGPLSWVVMVGLGTMWVGIEWASLKVTVGHEPAIILDCTTRGDSGAQHVYNIADPLMNKAKSDCPDSAKSRQARQATATAIVTCPVSLPGACT
jgi:hypothetical protein